MTAWWVRYIGLPYKEKGRGPDGFDCYGLVRHAYQNELGVTLPSFADEYRTDHDRHLMRMAEDTTRDWLSVEEPKAFDVILLRQTPLHIGVVTRPGWMLHTSRGMDACHERYTLDRWVHAILGFHRYV